MALPAKCFWHFNKDQIISQWWPEQCSFLSLTDCGRAKVFTYIYDFTAGEPRGSRVIILKWWQTVSYPTFPTVQVSLHKVFNSIAHLIKKKKKSIATFIFVYCQKYMISRPKMDLEIPKLEMHFLAHLKYIFPIYFGIRRFKIILFSIKKIKYLRQAVYNIQYI